MYSDWLLNTSIEQQFSSFKKGFDLVMKSNYLDDMFTAEEVELLVCGSQVEGICAFLIHSLVVRDAFLYLGF